MPNRFKALVGIAVVALAIIATVGTASATTANFSSNKYPLALTGPGVEATTASPELFCLPNLNGEITAKAASISVTPKYEEGCWIGETAATVATEGCTYTFTAGTLTESGSEGSMQIVCPSGKEIKIIAGECVVKIPPTSKPISPVIYKNVQSIEESKVQARFERPLSFWQNSHCGGTEGTYTATWVGNYNIETSNHQFTVWL